MWNSKTLAVFVLIEVAIDDIKTQLSKALMTGASITKVDESNGTYTLTLSDHLLLLA